MNVMRLVGDPGKAGKFSVDSASTPGTQYTVLYVSDDVVDCTCPAFTYRSECKHADEVKRSVHAETGIADRVVAAHRLKVIEEMFA